MSDNCFLPQVAQSTITMSYTGMSSSLQPPVVPRAVVSATGKTRLQAAVDNARTGAKPAIGQWITIPGYMHARTVASQGTDVRMHPIC